MKEQTVRMKLEMPVPKSFEEVMAVLVHAYGGSSMETMWRILQIGSCVLLLGPEGRATIIDVLSKAERRAA